MPQKAQASLPPDRAYAVLGCVAGGNHMLRFCGVIIAALYLFVSWPAHADPAGDKLIQNYVLTMEKVRANRVAGKALMAALEKDPSLKAIVEARMADQSTATVAGAIASFDKYPRVYKFYQDQGLSKEEAVLLPMALMSASMAVNLSAVGDKSFPLATSPAQIDFVRKNKAELDRMNAEDAVEMVDRMRKCLNGPTPNKC